MRVPGCLCETLNSSSAGQGVPPGWLRDLGHSERAPRDVLASELRNAIIRNSSLRSLPDSFMYV